MDLRFEKFKSQNLSSIMKSFYLARLTAVLFSIICFSFSNTVAQSSGVVSTLAGSGTSGYTDGTGTSAQFTYPFRSSGRWRWKCVCSGSVNHRIRKITTSGVVSTLAGSGHLAIQMVQGHRLSLNILQE